MSGKKALTKNCWIVGDSMLLVGPCSKSRANSWSSSLPNCPDYSADAAAAIGAVAAETLICTSLFRTGAPLAFSRGDGMPVRI